MRGHGTVASFMHDGLRTLVRRIGTVAGVGPPQHSAHEPRPAVRLTPIQDQFRHAVLRKFAEGSYRLEDVPRCPCGSDKSVPLAEQDRFGLPIGVVVCLHCGLARTSPRLAAENLPRFYKDDYHGLHMGVPDPDASISLFRAGQGAAIYAQMAGLLAAPSIRVAEVGCGTGQVLREFLTAAADDGRTGEGIGCEYAPAYVLAGRSTGSDIREGGPDVLDGTGPFDLVILSHVLEHFADIPAEMAIISRLAGERGYVYVEVPGILSIHRKPEYEFEFLQYLTVAHTYHFCLDSLTDVMRRSGLDLVSGDEIVTSVFQPARQRRPWRAPKGPGPLLTYLTWLRSSRTMRVRRMALKVGRSARGAARETLRGLLGARLYRVVRGEMRRLRVIR